MPDRLRGIAGELKAMLADHVDDVWLVGGVVRDALIDRDLPDIDIVVSEGSTERVARTIARATGGAPFPLGDRFGCWRVTAGAGNESALAGAQVDVCAQHDMSIEDDLALRDLTINAMAVSCADSGTIVDPHDGLTDLTGRRIRMVAERAFDDDPLRMIRVARFAHALNYDIDDATADAVRARAGAATQPAGERVFEEFSPTGART